jgi:phosphohistidine phosphatase SixA
MRPWRICLCLLSLLAALAAFGGPAGAQQLAGQALVDALRQGGYVLVIRHANSPAAVPDRASADPENTTLERQLDATGRDTARAMGAAFIKLHIPLGNGLSSPSYRARETARYARFSYESHTELDEGAAGMTALAEKARADFLRAKTNELPPAHQNKVIISHAPNIISAFGKDADGIASGETMVFRPGATGATLVARVKIEDWPKLANGG